MTNLWYYGLLPWTCALLFVYTLSNISEVLVAAEDFQKASEVCINNEGLSSITSNKHRVTSYTCKNGLTLSVKPDKTGE